MVHSWKCHSRGTAFKLPKSEAVEAFKVFNTAAENEVWEVYTKVEIGGLVRFTIGLAYRKFFYYWCSVDRFTSLHIPDECSPYTILDSGQRHWFHSTSRAVLLLARTDPTPPQPQPSPRDSVPNPEMDNCGEGA